MKGSDLEYENNIYRRCSSLTNNTPSSRKETCEEYRELQLKKLRYIYENIAENDSIIIITGDVFHSSAMSMIASTPKFYNDIIDIMKSKPTYTIIGNHDMYFRNEEKENSTLLANLLKTGVQHLDYLSFSNKFGLESLNIYGVDFGKDFPIIPFKENTYNIIVAHSFYEDSFYGVQGNENLTEEVIKNSLGEYDTVVLGHDHTAYPILDFKNSNSLQGYTKIIRPGSLLRGTSHTCQVNRIPQVAVFNTSDLSWKYEQIPVSPGQDVFKEKVLLEKELDINMESILKNIDSFDKSVDLYKFIKSNENKGREVFKDRYDSIIDIIEQYLNTYGFIKN